MACFFQSISRNRARLLAPCRKPYKTREGIRNRLPTLPRGSDIPHLLAQTSACHIWVGFEKALHSRTAGQCSLMDDPREEIAMWVSLEEPLTPEHKARGSDSANDNPGLELLGEEEETVLRSLPPRVRLCGGRCWPLSDDLTTLGCEGVRTVFYPKRGLKFCAAPDGYTIALFFDAPVRSGGKCHLELVPAARVVPPAHARQAVGIRMTLDYPHRPLSGAHCKAGIS